MGSHGLETEDPSNEIHVLVTGFGPFRDNPINPSFLIAQSLPPILPPSSKPSSSSSSTTQQPLPTIHIHAHPAPIRVAYGTVRSTIPALIFPSDNRPAYDLVLHIGMAPGRKFFTLETVAHRDGYTKEDVEGLTMRGDGCWREEVWAPAVLGPRWEGWCVDDVWRRWKGAVSDEDVRLSTDAGRYLCDFTFYTGLVEYWRRDPGGVLPVVFLHVPGGAEEGDVRRGERVAVGLVRALVENMMAGRGQGEGDLVVGFEEM